MGFVASLMSYLLTVVLTTPNLPPFVSLTIPLRMNPHVAVGIPLGVGVQAYLTSFVKETSCPVRRKGAAFGGTAGGSAVAASLSFFGLTQVGCCTLWLFVLSVLPSLIGSGVAAFLIQYSNLLSSVSLALVWIPAIWLALRIRTVRRL